MSYRGRHRQVVHFKRRLSAVAALTASAMLAPLILTGPGATQADVGPGIDPIYIQSERLDDVVTTVGNFVNNCTASDGVCTNAAETAQDALATAQACINATASELGISPAASQALAAVALDCREVVRLTVGLANFVVQVASDCVAENMAECQTVFNAARLGMDRAAGCLAAVLPVAMSGTDPGCASAMAMLYREAEGLIAILTGCLYGSDIACTTAREYAQFAIDGLSGCAGDLWVYYTDVPSPFPAGPLNCYAVLDQVNVAINGLLGQVPGLPTQITPTGDEECSIMVAVPLPTFDPFNPNETKPPMSVDEADVLVPSCNEPEWPQQMTNVTTPGIPATGLEEGPTCQETDIYVLDKEKPKVRRDLWHKVIVNVNGEPMPVTFEEEVVKKWKAGITAGAEFEVNTWIKKMNVELKMSVEYEKTARHTVKVGPFNLKPHTELHMAVTVSSKVAEGRHIWQHDDCSQTPEFRRVRAPYFDTWWKWEEPYNGDHP